MAVTLQILAPAPGTLIPGTPVLVSTRVTVSNPTGQHTPTDRLNAVSAEIDDGPPAEGHLSGGVWRATPIPPAVPPQTPLTITVTAAYTHTEWRQTGPGEWEPSNTELTRSATVPVVAGASPLAVQFDPFSHDVAVSTPPYATTLGGSVTPVRWPLRNVEATVDGVPAALGNESGNWTRWTLNISLAPGVHAIAVSAEDTATNTGRREESVAVTVIVPPTPVEQAFAPTSYLSELLALCERRIRLGGPAGPTPAQLEQRLHQPFARLVAPATYTQALAPIGQPRIAIEVLRRVLPAAQTESLDQTFRGRAYEALLRQLGTTSEELRLARRADEETRGRLATRLGVGIDRLDTITISPEAITDRQLERRFGYRSTQPADRLAVPPEPQLPGWRLERLRAQWAEADIRERDQPGRPIPVIDPDVISERHLAAGPGNGARTLWTQRSAQLHRLETQIAARFSGAGRTPTGFDAALVASGVSIDVLALADRDAAGDDVSAEAYAAGLGLDGLRRLAHVRRLTESNDVVEAEWADVVAICGQAAKRVGYAVWRLEERAAGIVLEPATFVAVSHVAEANAEDTGSVNQRWRGDLTTLVEWRRTLAGRARQAEELGSGQQSMVVAAEAQVLPALRDALLAELGRRGTPPETSRQVAERLSRDLAIDLQAGVARLTTRVEQAIDTLQSLLVGVRTGRLPSSGGGQVTIPDESAFDAEWEWLESYDRWRSGLEAFAYPETRLLPELFRAESIGGGRALIPTHAYTAFLDELTAKTRLDPAAADHLAASYLTALGQSPDSTPVTIELRRNRTDAEIDEHRKNCRDLVGAAATEAAIASHVREIFWLVPVALARALQASGHFREALDWYQTVFAFHRAGQQRFVYTGMAIEQRTESTYTRSPDWAAFARELNPHFTARRRRGAYTRFTVLSILECFCEFADSEFARDAADANARARALYQTAADLLGLAEVQPEIGPAIPYPTDPIWDSLRARADAGLAKVHAGLNLTALADPGRTESSMLPSPYRFQVVLDRAKAVVALAQQVEASYLASLERADAETYNLNQAGQDLRVARAAVITQGLREQAAVQGVEQATLQADRAQVQYAAYDQRITEGLSAAERHGLEALGIAEILHGTAGVAKLMANWQVWKVAENLAGALAEAAAVASTEAQRSQIAASYERRQQDWELARSIAAVDRQVAARQITTAVLQHSIAEQERQVAVGQAEHAAAVAEFLATKFTNAALYRWMSGVLGRSYATLLQQATALAGLAESQLAFERQEPVTNLVAADYWNVSSRGLTGSVRLLTDLNRLDQHAFDTDRRKLHLSQTFSMAQIAAAELQELRETGRLTVATPMSLFDRDFPGHYLRLIKRVELSVIAVAPATRGLRATLTASGISRTVVARGPFEMVTLSRDPESIAFTSPFNATGLFKLETEGGMLLPFEGMGVDTVWQLELPRAANPFDYRGIADVLLTVDYTALDSGEYRQTVLHGLDFSYSSDRSFSIRNEFPDVWYALNNPDSVGDPAQAMHAILSLTREDFPPHIEQLRVAQVALFIARADTFTEDLVIPSLRHTRGGQTIEAGEARTDDGVVSTRRSSGAPWQVLIDGDPTGDWDLEFEDSERSRSWFANGLVKDVVLVLTLSGTTPSWP